MVAQQQEHAEGRAVQVGGVAQVDDIASRSDRDALVGVAEILMGPEVEAPLDLDGQLLPIGRGQRSDGHGSLLVGVADRGKA